MLTWGHRVALPSLQNISWHSRMIFALRWSWRREQVFFFFFCPVNHEGYIKVTFREPMSSTYQPHAGFTQPLKVFESLGKVEVLLYVHGNHRLIRDGSPGWPPRLSHSSWALFGKFKNGMTFSRPWTSVKVCEFVVFRALGKNYQLIGQKLHFPRPNSSFF